MTEQSDPKTRNRKRSKSLSLLKMKNNRLYTDMMSYCKNTNMNDATLKEVETFRSNIFACANMSLYSEDSVKQFTYISSNTCKNKCCFICNWNREKRVRSKYLSWFKDNQQLNQVSVNGKSKILTADQLSKIKANDPGIKVNYDLMHLTLTVPHYLESGFNGDKYYYSRIVELFNFMRKDKVWLSMVYGGEFGVETTMSKNGLNIHIHALLLVRNQQQSRNKLHRFILKKWSHLTIAKNSTRQLLTMPAIEKMFESNSILTYHDLIDIEPRGGTIIGLETIYSYVNGEKVRTNDWNSVELIKAIMEAISYHFEPHAFNKKDKTIDIPLLIEILPKVKNKILYRKFGCLHKEERLNLNYKNEAAKLQAELAEFQEMQVDESTGELTTGKEYFILNPSHVCHDEQNDNKIFLSKKGRKMRKFMHVNCTTDAVKVMSSMVLKSHGKRSNYLTSEKNEMELHVN